MSIYSLSYPNKGKENYQDSQNYWGYRNEGLANYCAAGQGKICTDQDDPKLQKCCDLNNCYIQELSQFCMFKCGDYGPIFSGDCSVPGFDPDTVCQFFGGKGYPLPLPSTYQCKTIPS